MKSGMDNDIKKKLEIEKQKVGSWGHLVKTRADIVLKYAGGRILDVGCSSGAYVRLLRNKGYEAYGLDLYKIRNGKMNMNLSSKLGIFVVFRIKIILLTL